MSLPIRTLREKSRISGIFPSFNNQKSDRTAPALEPLTAWTSLRSIFDICPRNAKNAIAPGPRTSHFINSSLERLFLNTRI